MGFVNSVIILLVSTLLAVSANHKGTRKNDNSKPTEDAVKENSFSIQDQKFIFFPDQNATWSEAVDLCPKLVNDSYLAMVDRRDYLQFMAFVLHKNPHIIEDRGLLWVDGTYEDGEWIWEGSKTTIPPKNSVDRYPLWTGNTPRTAENCLAIEKIEDGTKSCSALFHADVCESRHGFICRKRKINSADV
ncbi:uncharacterized protein LOC124155049 [Ischnura elegans]|uniref:uncharacterized protein LOC124155049 n=1 Tax=Ischnura elegans TaxID=197161 RepID=UPI001ED87DDE|nr:uncharacterized protein LOC124155049 [Ischnura elegans]